VVVSVEAGAVVRHCCVVGWHTCGWFWQGHCSMVLSGVSERGGLDAGWLWCLVAADGRWRGWVPAVLGRCRLEWAGVIYTLHNGESAFL